MSGEVISIGKLTDDRAQELASAGVELQERVDLDDLNLSEPQYGEVFVFHADPDEVAIFYDLHTVTTRLEKWARELVADTMTKMGNKVRESDLQKPWHDALQDGDVKPEFTDDAEGEEFFRLQQRRQFLHALLYWKLGERAGMHGQRLGLRKPMAGEEALRVVKIERRW
jgi:hypothetical protein